MKHLLRTLAISVVSLLIAALSTHARAGSFAEVEVSAPNFSAEDVESKVTTPLENALAALPEVVEIRSVSRSNRSLIAVRFAKSVEHSLVETLKARIAGVKPTLPSGVGEPQVSIRVTSLLYPTE